MNKGKTIFSQIMSLIPERDFKTTAHTHIIHPTGIKTR